MKTANEKRVTYLLVCFGCLTISFNVAAITAAVPAISQSLVLPDLEVARIIPYYLVPYGLGALMYAPLTRFWAYRWVYVVSMLLYGLSCYICGSSQDLAVILAGRIGMGVAAAGAIPLGLMIIGEFYPKEFRGRLVGVFFSCAFIASIAGLLVGGMADWPWIFYIPAFLGGALAVCFSVLNFDILNRKHVGHINYLRVLADREIGKVFAFIFCISFLYHGVHKWYGVYLSRVYGFDKLTISIFFILTVIGGMIGQLSGGVLTDKKGRLYTCRLGLFGLAVSVMLLVGIYPKVFLGLVLLAVSVSWTVGHNGISTVLTDFSDEDRPVIASLNSAVRFISGGLGFAVSSWFVEKSFSLTFFIIGCLMLLMTFILSRVVPKNT